MTFKVNYEKSVYATDASGQRWFAVFTQISELPFAPFTGLHIGTLGAIERVIWLAESQSFVCLMQDEELRAESIEQHAPVLAMSGWQMIGEPQRHN